MVNGAFMILKGHRSIVNQVRFNPHNYMICSSGVEKVIKVSKGVLSVFLIQWGLGELKIAPKVVPTSEAPCPQMLTQ